MLTSVRRSNQYHVIHCPRIEASHHTFSHILEIKLLLLCGSLRNVPIDSLFVVNTLENIQIVQLFSYDRLQC